MIENIFSGVIANVLFAILIILIGWTMYFLTERRELLNFFGISDTKRLVIYLSNLRIIKDGSIGIDDRPRSYQGATVVYNEQAVATKFKESFNYLVPSLSDSPSFLSKILFADIRIISMPSPLDESDIEAVSSIITLGSPGYNIVSLMVEKNRNSAVRFTNDNREIQVSSIPNLKNPVNGFIQRLIIKKDNKNRCLFYVAGPYEQGTIGAAYYLVNNWKALRKKYKDNESFVIVLGFPSSNINNYTIEMERKIE